VENGVTIAQQLLEMLGIPLDNLIEGAYVDLLKQRGT
jgi:hypothetical protein